MEGEVRSRTPVEDRSNRVHWFAGRLLEVLADVTAGGARVAELSADETGESILELTEAINCLEGPRAAALAHADAIDVGAESAATSTGAWLAVAAVIPQGRGRRLVKLANRLENRYPSTGEALRNGSIDVEQAQVIADAVDALPAFVPATDRARAEAHLLGEAAVHDAVKLKVLGRHLLEVIDPEAADAELARRIAAEEATAARKTSLWMRDDGQGVCRGTFTIPSLHGAMLSAALDSLAAPTRPDPIPRQRPRPDGPGEGDADPAAGEPDEPTVVMRHPTEVMGEAFCQLLERIPTKRLPATGGGLVTVVVTIPLQLMLDGLGVATLSSGGHLSVGQVRRLACQAGVIPMVLGTKSEVLDLGRRSRVFSRAQRLAMTVRDRGCTVVGCDRAAAFCQGHHSVWWSRGGRTDLANGRLLCSRHHTLVHHPDYEHADAGNGRITISRTGRRRT
jgi:hypothetical protein